MYYNDQFGKFSYATEDGVFAISDAGVERIIFTFKKNILESKKIPLISNIKITEEYFDFKFDGNGPTIRFEKKQS